MPYNNTPINPADDVKGTTHLPMSRVKKIMAVDDEINQVSNHAVFLCTRAAELFVRHLADQAFTADRARSGGVGVGVSGAAVAGGAAAGGGGGKPKKSLQYEDIARLVHRTDNLEFLCDVIPEATSYSRYKREKRRKEDVLAEKKAKRATLAAGQTTLDLPRAAAAGSGADVGGGAGDDAAAPSRPSTSSAAPLNAVLNAVMDDGPGPEPQLNGGGGGGRDIRFRHYEPKASNGALPRHEGGGGGGDGDGDVNMDG